MAVSYFPNLIFLKTGILKNFRHTYPRPCCLQVSFSTPLVGPVAIFFSLHGMLSINVKISVSSTAKIHLVVCDASLLGAIKRFGRVSDHKIAQSTSFLKD